MGTGSARQARLLSDYETNPWQALPWTIFNSAAPDNGPLVGNLDVRARDIGPTNPLIPGLPGLSLMRLFARVRQWQCTYGYSGGIGVDMGGTNFTASGSLILTNSPQWIRGVNNEPILPHAVVPYLSAHTTNQPPIIFQGDPITGSEPGVGWGVSCYPFGNQLSGQQSMDVPSPFSAGDCWPRIYCPSGTSDVNSVFSIPYVIFASVTSGNRPDFPRGVLMLDGNQYYPDAGTGQFSTGLCFREDDSLIYDRTPGATPTGAPFNGGFSASTASRIRFEQGERQLEIPLIAFRQHENDPFPELQIDFIPDPDAEGGAFYGYPMTPLDLGNPRNVYDTFTGELVEPYLAGAPLTM